MSRLLAVVLVTTALGVVTASPAAADKLAIAEEPYSATFPFQCRSSEETLEFHNEGTDRTFVFFDRNGTPSKVKVVNREVGSITNLRTGESITWKGQRQATFTPDEALEVGSEVISNFSGLNFILRGPDGKVIVVSSGHATFRAIVVRFVQGIPVFRTDRAFNTPHLTHFFEVVFDTAETLLC